MISFFKKNKLFSFLLVLTIITFIGSIFLTAIIDNDTKLEIHNNVISILHDKSIQKKMLTNDNFFTIFYKNVTIIIFIWLLGISIIGIPIILFFYLIKVLLLGWNVYFLFSHFDFSNCAFIIIYLFSPILFLLILFLLSYYAISYSTILFKLVFKRREFSIYKITRRYIKILIMGSIVALILSLFNFYFVPKILLFL